MTKMSNLPRDLAEEMLCRIPLTSLRRVRSTCKKWNTLSKRKSFSKKHLGGQAKVGFMAVMMMDFRIYLMSVNLHDENVESCINRQGKLISLHDSDQIDVRDVFHCDGLLLCITKDYTRIVVWNPYVGQPRWIESTHKFQRLDLYNYALGYDKSTKSHKILRFVDMDGFVELKIYDCNSDLWRVLDNNVIPDMYMNCFYRGLSLKGNTYWYAREKYSETREFDQGFLVCFDFTKERFVPLLPLPFEQRPEYEDTVTISSVRGEQLAVLYQQWDTLHMEIWVTSKIEPNAVSWNNKVFLSVNMRPLTCFGFQFLSKAACFFIDEEKKVVVVFDKDKELTHKRNVAYIVGVDGTLKEADLGETAFQNCYPLVCSYAPSLVGL